TPFTSHNVAVFRSKLTSSRAGGTEAIRISRVKDDLHLEQLGGRGQTIVGFVLHPITGGAKKGRKVTAVEITRMDSRGESSSLGRRDRAALAAIVDELSQFKESSSTTAPGVAYFWHELWTAVDAGIACGLAGVEGGLNPIADAGCAVATGLTLDDDDDD